MLSPTTENIAGPAGPGGSLAAVSADRGRLGRVSTAKQVADVLRVYILEGQCAPGTRLSEEAIGHALGVSRNTLREAFQILTHERLLVHEMNRGVFVQILRQDDVRDIYRMRVLIECSAIRESRSESEAVAAAELQVEAGEQAAERHDWSAVATADLRFHLHITELAGSSRADAMMRTLLAELRLIFHLMPDLAQFHMPYLRRNREILNRLKTGEKDAAERLLRAYLEDAEKQILDAVVQGRTRRVANTVP